MEYGIVSDVNPTKLEEHVNEAIAKGYKPFGGLQVVPMPPNKEGALAIFVQAMLKIDVNERWPL